MTEIELKFLIDEAAEARLRERVREAGAALPPPRLLRSVYHDTLDHAIRASGAALRVRRDGRRWVQTVKVRLASQGGRSEAQEYEAPAPGGRLDLDLVPDEAMRARLAEIVGEAALAPVCETAIRRASVVLDLGERTRAELSLDIGEVIAGELSASLRELELELIEGDVAPLYAFAAGIFRDGGLRFSHLSKAERGHLLASDGVIDPPPGPRSARGVALTSDMSVEQAAQAVFRECFDQIEANVAAVLAGEDPEGPHRLRIGLRRFRSAVLIFRPAMDCAEMRRLNDEARWLGGEVGELRNIDVAIADILAPEALAHPEEPGFSALSAALFERLGETRAAVRAALAGPRAQGFLIDLARFTEARGWLLPGDIDQTRRLAAPVGEAAAAALAKRWKGVRKRAGDLEGMSVEARHDLRKELKKFRYVSEFLAPLYPAKRAAAFSKRLKKLQTVFGRLNDAAMAEEMFMGPGAPAQDDPAAQRAAGRILGARLAEADHAWADARRLWDDLNGLKTFW